MPINIWRLISITAGPFTLFAPTDVAFKALPSGSLESLLANPEKLKNTLLNHVLSGKVYSRGLSPSAAVKTIGGDSVQIIVSNRKLVCTWFKQNLIWQIKLKYFFSQVECLSTKLK